jgi:hypothetical protein
MNTVTIPYDGRPWNTVYALAESEPIGHWILAGGLMVQLHAIMGGLSARPTTDVDLLVDLITDRNGIRTVTAILSGRGYSIQPGSLTGYTTRMSTTNGDVVDILVADHLPANLKRDATFINQPVLPMPAGAQAKERSMQVKLIDKRHHATVTIPDLLGALILKAAAYEVDKAGFGERHLYDAALLASLITDPDHETARLHSKNDRKRLQALKQHLTPDSEYWNSLDEAHRVNGLDAVETLAAW